MTIQYIIHENKNGIFLSLKDWKALQNELLTLKTKMLAIEKRRNELAASAR